MKVTKIKAKKILLIDIELPRANYKAGDVVFVQDVYIEGSMVVIGFRYEGGGIGEAGFPSKGFNVNSKKGLFDFCSNIFAPYYGPDAKYFFYSNSK